ncbi:MAG: hypothetical protein HYW47_01780 [Deltaproteobacteria bacterium]|nr:hypothetical protein [Deltaproteobacteria bacterium]
MQENNKKNHANNSATRDKLAGLPFQKASELKKFSDELRFEIWKQLERARLFNEMSKKEDYKFIQEEFKHGLTCKYGNNKDSLVKVFSEGQGIQIDINKILVQHMPHSEPFVETLIRSMGDTFSKAYYQAKGILPSDHMNIGDTLKDLKKVLKENK